MNDLAARKQAIVAEAELHRALIVTEVERCRTVAMQARRVVTLSLSLARSVSLVRSFFEREKE
jgi:hypothetical protein